MEHPWQPRWCSHVPPEPSWSSSSSALTPPGHSVPTLVHGNVLVHGDILVHGRVLVHGGVLTLSSHPLGSGSARPHCHQSGGAGQDSRKHFLVSLRPATLSLGQVLGFAGSPLKDTALLSGQAASRTLQR